MSQILNLLRPGRGNGQAEAIRQSTSLTMAYLLAQNRKFEQWMREKVAELEERVAGERTHQANEVEAEEPEWELEAEAPPDPMEEATVTFMDLEQDTAPLAPTTFVPPPPAPEAAEAVESLPEEPPPPEPEPEPDPPGWAAMLGVEPAPETEPPPPAEAESNAVDEPAAATEEEPALSLVPVENLFPASEEDAAGESGSEPRPEGSADWESEPEPDMPLQDGHRGHWD